MEALLLLALLVAAFFGGAAASRVSTFSDCAVYGESDLRSGDATECSVKRKEKK